MQSKTSLLDMINGIEDISKHCEVCKKHISTPLPIKSLFLMIMLNHFINSSLIFKDLSFQTIRIKFNKTAIDFYICWLIAQATKAPDSNYICNSLDTKEGKIVLLKCILTNCAKEFISKVTWDYLK